MKKFSLILVLFLLFCLSGCVLQHSDIKEPVKFYYPRQEIICGQKDGVIGSEIREASGHKDDLQYLLTSYLQGPMASNLSSPFPPATKLVSMREKDGCLYLVLNAAVSHINSIELTTLGACLAMTCFELTDVTSIHIESTPLPDGKAISVTFARDKLILTDDTPLTEPIPTESE